MAAKTASGAHSKLALKSKPPTLLATQAASLKMNLKQRRKTRWPGKRPESSQRSLQRKPSGYGSKLTRQPGKRPESLWRPRQRKLRGYGRKPKC